ncbi:hypothetical protein F53441_5693 [Fusarium austroafricanum]|uniref:Uncharacterized protein n=1 Tax=Fusarium austroafricanum TaxID=2364996 RepID=A0A8H4KJ34_9HYPO|nr:hypothetical protein F53441_5693 [Fusarium austroafricanum]
MPYATKETFHNEIGKQWYEHKVPKAWVHDYYKFCYAVEEAFPLDSYHIHEYDANHYSVMMWKQYDLKEKLEGKDNGLTADAFREEETY